eukprot:2608864-Alexandrium_andersonii.AAC.1
MTTAKRRKPPHAAASHRRLTQASSGAADRRKQQGPSGTHPLRSPDRPHWGRGCCDCGLSVLGL